MRNKRMNVKNYIWACFTLALLVLFSACSEMHEPILHAYGKTVLRMQVEMDAGMKSLGYTIPESYHVDFYDATSEAWMNERNVMGDSTSLYLTYGWYHMLFYNNDTQLLRLQYHEQKRNLEASTENDPYVSLPDTLKKKLDVRQMPDLLYVTYDKDIHVSDDLMTIPICQRRRLMYGR